MRFTAVSRELRDNLQARHDDVTTLFSGVLHPTASGILDVGAEVIMAGGGGALTMRAVAKQANLKLASLQYYFKTFEELVSALFLREFGTIAGLIWRVFTELEQSALSPVDALRKAAESFMPEEGYGDENEHRIYFHLMAFCSYNRDAFFQARVFYAFYNTLMAYLISRVNPKLGLEECMARAILITSTLEGTGVYTILKAAGESGEKTAHREVGTLAVHYAKLPALRAASDSRRKIRVLK